MRRLTVKLLLLIMILLNVSWVANAQTFEPDFNKMFDDHGSIMLLIDSQSGYIEYANKAAIKFYGYSFEQLKSLKISDINTLSAEETAREMEAAVNEHRNHFVFKHRLANGEIRTVEVYSSPHVVNDKVMLLSIIQDITAKVQLEDKSKRMNNTFVAGLTIFILLLLIFSVQLSSNNRKLKKKNEEIHNFNELRKTFIDADNRLIYLKDENLKYIFVNKALEDFYQRKSTEIIGNDDFALTEQEFAEIRKRTDLEVLNKKAHLITDIRWEDKIYRSNKFPIKLLNGHNGVGAYIEDITEVRKSDRANEKTLLRNSILVDF